MGLNSPSRFQCVPQSMMTLLYAFCPFTGVIAYTDIAFQFSQPVVPHLSGEGCQILCQLSRLILRLLFHLLRRTSTASSRSRCSPQGPNDPNSKLWSKVFPAGPQLHALDRSVPRRTRTASSGSECSPPDLKCKRQIAVFPAGPEQQAQDQSVPSRTDPKESSKIQQIECQKEWQIECQNRCQIECQVKCQNICQNICHNICLEMPWWGSLEVKYFLI